MYPRLRRAAARSFHRAAVLPPCGFPDDLPPATTGGGVDSRTNVVEVEEFRPRPAHHFVSLCPDRVFTKLLATHRLGACAGVRRPVLAHAVELADDAELFPEEVGARDECATGCPYLELQDRVGQTCRPNAEAADRLARALASSVQECAHSSSRRNSGSRVGCCQGGRECGVGRRPQPQCRVASTTARSASRQRAVSTIVRAAEVTRIPSTISTSLGAKGVACTCSWEVRRPPEGRFRLTWTSVRSGRHRANPCTTAAEVCSSRPRGRAWRRPRVRAPGAGRRRRGRLRSPWAGGRLRRDARGRRCAVLGGSRPR